MGAPCRVTFEGKVFFKPDFVKRFLDTLHLEDDVVENSTYLKSIGYDNAFNEGDPMLIREKKAEAKAEAKEQAKEEISQTTAKEEGVVKPVVQDVYNSNPEIASIGTVQEYSQYLDSVFPDSKLKDILYHGSRNADRFDNFDDNLIGELDTGFFGKGIYFSPDAKYAQGYANQAIDKKGQLYAVIVNLQNPLNTDTNQANKNWGRDVIEDYDGALVIEGAWLNPEINGIEPVGYNPNTLDEVVVKSSSQTHILGSKQDIEGFKEFTESKNKINKAAKAAPTSIFDDFDTTNKRTGLKGKVEANKAFREKYGEDAAVAKAISSNFEAIADELKAKGIFTKIKC